MSWSNVSIVYILLKIALCLMTEVVRNRTSLKLETKRAHSNYRVFSWGDKQSIHLREVGGMRCSFFIDYFLYLAYLKEILQLKYSKNESSFMVLTWHASLLDKFLFYKTLSLVEFEEFDRDHPFSMFLCVPNVYDLNDYKWLSMCPMN